MRIKSSVKDRLWQCCAATSPPKLRKVCEAHYEGQGFVKIAEPNAMGPEGGSRVGLLASSSGQMGVSQNGLLLVSPEETTKVVMDPSTRVETTALGFLLRGLFPLVSLS